MRNDHARLYEGPCHVLRTCTWLHNSSQPQSHTSAGERVDLRSEYTPGTMPGLSNSGYSSDPRPHATHNRRGPVFPDFPQRWSPSQAGKGGMQHTGYSQGGPGVDKIITGLTPRGPKTFSNKQKAGGSGKRQRARCRVKTRGKSQAPLRIQEQLGRDRNGLVCLFHVVHVRPLK